MKDLRIGATVRVKKEFFKDVDVSVQLNPYTYYTIVKEDGDFCHIQYEPDGVRIFMSKYRLVPVKGEYQIVYLRPDLDEVAKICHDGIDIALLEPLRKRPLIVRRIDFKNNEIEIDFPGFQSKVLNLRYFISEDEYNFETKYEVWGASTEIWKNVGISSLPINPLSSLTIADLKSLLDLISDELDLARENGKSDDYEKAMSSFAKVHEEFMRRMKILQLI